MSLEESLRFDDLHRIEYNKCSTYLHRDHRWDLCILKEAQEKRLVPSPCDLVMFDQHYDGLQPRCLDKIRGLRSSDFTIEQLTTLCQSDLSKNDDDWLIAGMELGMIRDVVMFGVHSRYDARNFPERLEDHAGSSHRTKILGRLDGELRYKGKLSDVIYRDSLSWIWDILRWQYGDDHRFSFVDNGEPIWVSFDLDVFAFRWSDYVLPWSDEIFCNEFLRRSEAYTTPGWTAKDFLHGLLELAGLFTISTEPGCCGGMRNVGEILERLNRYVLDDALEVPSLAEEEE